MTDIIGRPDEASGGIYQDILKVEGVLQPLKRVPSRFDTQFESDKPANDQVEIVLEEAEILEMAEGQEAPELKDDRFTTWLGYAPPGKEKPHKNTFFAKGFCAYAVELAKARGIENGGLHDLVGSRICLERKEVFLFKRHKKDDPDEYEEFNITNFVPVECPGDEGSLDEYVVGLIVGKNKAAAKRAVLLDGRAKKHPQYKEAIDNDTIGDMIGVGVDKKGLYQLP